MIVIGRRLVLTFMVELTGQRGPAQSSRVPSNVIPKDDCLTLNVAMKGRSGRRLPIDSPEKDFHGFDAYEFAEFLESRNQEFYRDVGRELEAW